MSIYSLLLVVFWYNIISFLLLISTINDTWSTSGMEFIGYGMIGIFYFTFIFLITLIIGLIIHAFNKNVRFYPDSRLIKILLLLQLLILISGLFGAFNFAKYFSSILWQIVSILFMLMYFITVITTLVSYKKEKASKKTEQQLNNRSHS